MGQVTIYVDDELETKLKTEAKAAGVSVSRWVAEIIQKQTENHWPDSVKALSGAWKDFPNLDDIRTTKANDVPRETF